MVLTKSELDLLENMYEGDRSRDASSKIRGFLFQDYVTINYILQDRVRYVCSEYIEDIDVFFSDGTIEIIQVKYHPKTAPNMKEILTDLYYHYLRLQILQSSLKPVPKLYIHTESQVTKPTTEQMETYIREKYQWQKAFPNKDSSDTGKWLKENVYIEKKKEDQKKKFFAEKASTESLRTFLEKFEILQESNIDSFQQQITEKLAQTYPNHNNGNDETWKLILFGLAISYVQQPYLQDSPTFSQRLIYKDRFNQHIKETIQTKQEQIISSYVVAIVCDEYENIIKNNPNLSEQQRNTLNQICQNTIQWIKNICDSVQGQYKLVNTFSTESADKIVDYKTQPIETRLIRIAECKAGITSFLDYLWKILLNIYHENIRNSEDNISEQSKLFDLFEYMNTEIEDYLCFKFPGDITKFSVILPPADSKYKVIKRNIVDRMVQMPKKPRKWYFPNTKSMMYGKKYYSYSTANINEQTTVVDLGDDSFYIECMKCIKIDADEWHNEELCKDCIFSEKCVN